MNQVTPPMATARRLIPHAWIPALLAALAFLAWVNVRRAARVEFVTHFNAASPAVDPSSPTGYAGGLRYHIAPGNNPESYEWMLQAQQVLSSGRLHLRRVDYDNAPDGRSVSSPSPYRWWLALLSWIHHRATGVPAGASVERVALWADPFLFMLFVTGTTVALARVLGGGSATVFPLAVSSVFPLGGAFLPGCPDDQGAAVLVTAGGVLCGLVGLAAATQARPAARVWWGLGGVFGALGVWLDAGTALPVIGSIGLAGLIGHRLLSRETALPWRAWAGGGAAALLLAWFAENAPDQLTSSLFAVGGLHPLTALSWWAGGELLHAMAAPAGLRSGAGARVRWVIFVALLLTPLAAMLGGPDGFLAHDSFSTRLSALRPEIAAGSFWGWAAEGNTAVIAATLVPLVALLPAVLVLRRGRPVDRALVCFAGIPLLAAAGLALVHLSGWVLVGALGALLLGAIWGPSSDALSHSLGYRWLSVLAAGLFTTGLGLLLPVRTEPGERTLSRAELEALLERDIAHWLARRAGGEEVIALAPPRLTVSLIFHGRLRGLGTPYVENRDGFRSATRVAGATSADEAHALVQRLRMTHILLPSWDRFLDDYARLGATQPEGSLIGVLHRWLPPRWLRPVPYPLPGTPELAADRLVVFEVTEVQEPAVALGRLTEYFVDMGQTELAGRAARALAGQYGGDLGALVAKARTEIARRDGATFAQSLSLIEEEVRSGADEALAWDRRVSLTLVLAEGGLVTDAQAQARRCLEAMTERELRRLPVFTLHRFLTLCQALGLEVADPKLRQLSQSLLPPSLQAHP